MSTDQYRITNKEFREHNKRIHDNLRHTYELTAKVYESEHGIHGAVPGYGDVTIRKSDVRRMWTIVLKEQDELNKYFAASTKKVKVKREKTAKGFERPKKFTEKAYQFFTTANMGRINPLMTNGGYTLDAQGKPVANPLEDSNSIQVKDWLTSNAASPFNERIARGSVLTTLLYIYARENMLAQYADGAGVGVNISNRNKPYREWETAYYGATQPLYDAFSDSFDKIRTRSRQPKLDSKGEPVVKNGVTQTYEAMDANFFMGTAAFSVIKADNTVKEPPIPVPDKEVFSRYVTAVNVAENNAPEGELINHVAIAQSVAPEDTALELFAKVDLLQSNVSHINSLHAINYKNINAVRDKYRAEQKKAART